MSAAAARRLALCADDFGQTPQINLAVIELIRAGRLGATSVMSQGAAWPEGARELKQCQHLADIGLHLNLTHAFDGQAATRPLPYWMLAAPLGLIDADSIRDSLRRQIDGFVAHLGRLPDYIDGHQHVHAFPRIRELVTAVIAEYWQEGAKPWVRAPDRLADFGDEAFKGRVLGTITRGFAAHLAREGLRYPASFAGLYSLRPEADYPALMRHWLQDLPDGTLVMCHPGHRCDDPSDPIRAAREEEYRYLASAAFEDDCRAAGVVLGRV